MEFEQLTQEYRDDYLARALQQREMEWFHYDFDRATFESLLRTLPAGDYRVMVERRLAETLAQMEHTEAIYRALRERIVDPEAHAAAIVRIKTASA